LALSVRGAVSLAQTFWLVPALDLRAFAIQRGQSTLPSQLHTLYIAAEVLEVLWLLVLGVGDLLSSPGNTCGSRPSRQGAGPTARGG
jgi:hypothetical protein